MAQLAKSPSFMTTSKDPTPVAPGEVIDGKYRVDEVLGVGGMGIVVAATHLHLDQRVALKFLLPTALAHADVVARFAREARSAVKIQSQHVAKVLDVGTLSTGAPYMVMEYLDGEDLEKLLTRVGPLAVQDAVDYVMQACEAVAEAHGYGIVHRDLKPANLFLASRANGRPVVKVLDFGISKSLNKAEASLTKTSAVMGSPLYMSPEQMASARHADVRSDIWALGIILYEVLTQRLPFTADSMPELIVAVLHRTPDSLRSVRPDVPDGLESAVMRCLEKEPGRRFPDIAALATALAPYGRDGSGDLVERISHSLAIERRSIPAVPSTTGPVLDARVSAPTVASSFTEGSWTQSKTVVGKRGVLRRGRTRALVGVGLAVATLAVVGGFAWTHRQANEPTASSMPSVQPASTAAPPPPSSTTSAEAESHASPPATGEPPAATVPDGPVPSTSTALPPTAKSPHPVAHPAILPVSSVVPRVGPAPPPTAPPKANPLDLKLQN